MRCLEESRALKEEREGKEVGEPGSGWVVGGRGTPDAEGSQPPPVAA